MRSWKEILITPDVSIRKVIEIIDASSLQIALVVDSDGRLLGTVTDGDIRRGILRGLSIEQPVAMIMHEDAAKVNVHDPKAKTLELMKVKGLRHIPVVDDRGVVVGLELLDDIVQGGYVDNPVVLMAGGMGSRLTPLTENCPKPLLRVGGRPILETIIENLKLSGFNNLFVSVNYKAEMVKDYFGDGSKWGVQIRYLHETKRMGTAGALGLMPEGPSKPILVINGDVLTKVNFQNVLNFHREASANATMCVREYSFQVPYGVVSLDRHRLVSIDEKPIQHFFVNAGIYILNPECLSVIPSDSYFDMTQLFEALREKRMELAACPIREYWLDIGQKDDFERARCEFDEVFK